MLLRPLLLTALSVLLLAEEPAPPPGFSTARPQITITTSQGTIVAELFAEQAPETVRTIIELAEGLRASTRDGERGPHQFYDGLTFHRTIPDFMIQGGCPEGTGRGDPGFRFDDEINAASLGLEEAQAIQDPAALAELLLAGRGVAPQRQQALIARALHPQCSYQLRQVTELLVAPRLRAAGFGPGTSPEDPAAAAETAATEAAEASLADFYRAWGYTYDAELPASTAPTRGVLAMANSGPATNGSQFFITVADTPHLTGKHTVFGRVLTGMAVADAIAGVATGAQNRPTEPVVIESIRLTEPASPEALFTEVGADSAAK